MHVDVFVRLDKLLLVKAVQIVALATVDDVEDGYLVCLSEWDRRYKHDLTRCAQLRFWQALRFHISAFDSTCFFGDSFASFLGFSHCATLFGLQ